MRHHGYSKMSRLTRRRFLRSGAVASAAMAVPAFGQSPADDLRIAMALPPLGDPRDAVRIEAANVTRGWLEQLVELRPDGSLEGRLAENWRIDGNRIEITLRPGITWSNGDAFTARDVAWNFARWAEDSARNSMRARIAALLDPATGALPDGAVEVTGDTDLVLTLSRTDQTFMASLADYPAAILHPSANPADPWAAPGTGAFLPAGTYIAGGSVSLVRRDNWWGNDILGAPTLRTITFTDFGHDAKAETRALILGDVDMLFETRGVFADVLDAQGVARSEVEAAATVVIRARTAAEFDGFKPYESPEVRQALALMVDPELALDLGAGGAGTLGAHHHVSPTQPDYAETGAARFAPADARALLAATGMDNFPHRIISTRDPLSNDTADAVTAMLRDGGLNASRVRLEDADFWADWRAHPLSVTPWSARPEGVQTLALAYGSGSAWNETGYANAAFDAKLAEAQALEPEARRTVMADLQTMLVGDGVIIQPFWRRMVRHTRVPINGAEMHPYGALPLYRLGFA